MSSANEFREIEGLPGYFVDRGGNVASIKSGYFKFIKPQSRGKYLRIPTYQNGAHKAFYIHRIVLKTFSHNEDCDNLQVDHLNGIQSDNRLENLRWCTQQENIKFSVANRTHSFGERHGGSKFSEDQMKEIINYYLEKRTTSRTPIKDTSKKYGILGSALSAIVNGSTWKHLDIKGVVYAVDGRFRTHCRKGHELTKENSKLVTASSRSKPGRTCLICSKQYFKDYWIAKKERLKNEKL